MLRSLQPIKSSETEVVIGFNSAKQAEKAFWLNVSGAGKGRKKWKFLGLTKENEAKLATETGWIFRFLSIEPITLALSWCCLL